MSIRLRPAVFLDRDGTVNEQMGYINHISRFHLLPDAARAIKLLNDNNIPVIVVSNQSGLARGYFPEELLEEVNARMDKLLAEQGASIDGLYFCPHHPEAKEEKFRQTCNCRKPKIGMLLQAADELKLDLAKSFMVGDRWSDIKCAHKAGCTPILVLTGYGKGDHQYIGPVQEIQPAHTSENLYNAVEWILQRIEKD